MYGNSACYNMPPPPPGYMPWFGPPQQATPSFPNLRDLQEYIKGLKDFEKELKGKDEGPKKGKAPDVSVFSMMLLMLLLSPITGPSMYYFFQMSLGILHK